MARILSTFAQAQGGMMAKEWSVSGRGSMASLAVHRRWVLGVGGTRWMTSATIIIGGKLALWVRRLQFSLACGLTSYRNGTLSEAGLGYSGGDPPPTCLPGVHRKFAGGTPSKPRSLGKVGGTMGGR